jgi:hypothetical protein
MSPRNSDAIYSVDSINQGPISPDFEQLLINSLSAVFGRGRPSSGLTGIINLSGICYHRQLESISPEPHIDYNSNLTNPRVV